MFGSNVLEFALGMVFVYLLLSLLCSALNEAIEARLKNRAKDLERGLRELLNDPNSSGLVKQIYEHPLVSSLFKKDNPNDKSQIPSYIPARNFALALMDIALPATNTTASGATGATTSTTDADPITALREGINKNLSSNPEVQKAMLALVDAAGNNISKARENIENWFNSSMDRVSGWYKRRSHTIILVLGFVVAIGMNADTITIGQYLSNNETARSTLAAMAEAYAKKPTVQDNPEKPEENIKLIKGEIDKIGLPVGWDWKNYKDDPKGVPFVDRMDKDGNKLPAPDTGEDVRWWLTKIFGWMLTGIAISLGAPFWFDLLNKIIVIRSTIKPHEKSPEETSKDK